MYGEKRAQITVFILLGIIIVSVFAFLLNTTARLEREKVEAEADIIITEVKQTQSIKHYMYLCLKQAAEESLLMLGAQGGRIYDYQGGNTQFNNTAYKTIFVNGTAKNITYGITAPLLNPPNNFSQFPNVPWYPSIGLRQYFFVNTSNYYYLGKSTLPRLCDRDGPNKYNPLVGLSGASCSMRGSVRYFSDDLDTVQIQLADMTSRLARQCIDVDYFFNEVGYNISLEEPNTTIIFGENSVNVNSDFPMTLKFERPGLFYKEPKVTRFLSFSVNIPIRIKRIYDFAMQIAEQDKVNLTFDILEDYSATSSYKWLAKENEPIIVYKDLISSLDDDKIFRVTDYASIIRGVPYTFQFLIENRIPVLSWIHQAALSAALDIAVLEQGIVRINPMGYEPDEDTMTFNYSGWKETYDYFLNYSCCIAQDRNTTCLNTVQQGGCAEIFNNIEPHNWTLSQEFLDTSKDAAYTTSKSDIGIHEVNVSVCDPFGLCDWQTVKIIIYDTITAVPHLYNDYSDIQQEYASVEDKFTLSLTLLSVLPLENLEGMSVDYLWCDNQDFPECFETTQQIIVLPQPFNGLIDIETIKQFPFNSTDETHIVNLTLLGEAFGEESDELEIEVFECLPHRNPDVPIYPYYNYSDDLFFETVEDPFQADHTCCFGNPLGDSNNWYIMSGTECYNLKEYGPHFVFTIGHLDEIYEYSNETEDYTNIPLTFIDNIDNANGLNFASNDWIRQNDIFVREFSRSCATDDEKRGNTCLGDIDDTITVIECDDDVIEDGRDMRCSGPNFASDILFEQNSCTEYSFSTFDYEYNRIRGFPYNEHMRACSEITMCSTDTTYNDSTGHYLCNATCTGGGCTRSFYPDECYNCFEQNECYGPNLDIYIRGELSGFNYTGCGVNSCPATSFGPSTTRIVQDTCIDTNWLRQYNCVNPSQWDEVQTPYTYNEIRCPAPSQGGDAQCRNDTSRATYYIYRNASTCLIGQGICSEEFEADCTKGYACSGTGSKDSGLTCTQEGTCTDTNQCADGYYCRNDRNCIPFLIFQGDVCGNSYDDIDECANPLNCNLTDRCNY